MRILKFDVLNEISSELGPRSGLNYIFVAVHFMLLFDRIEEKLKRLRNPLWVEAYENNPSMMREKRALLIGLVLAAEDEECMKAMAQVFEELRAGFMANIYWKALDSPEEIIKRA